MKPSNNTYKYKYVYLLIFIFSYSYFCFSKNGNISVNTNYKAIVTTNLANHATCHEVNEKIVWKDIVNAVESSNTLTKTGGNNWNSDAVSLSKVYNYGSVSTIVDQTNYSRMIGLNDNNKKRDYSDLNYAILLKNNRTLQVFENGKKKENIGEYNLNDTIKISVEDNQVKYYRNHLLLYTSKTTYSTPLFVDCSLEKNGSRLSNVVINNMTPLSFSASLIDNNANLITPITYEWKLNGVTVGTNSNTYTNASLSSNDKITCDMTYASQLYLSNELIYNTRSHRVFTNFDIESQEVSSSCFNSIQPVKWENLKNVSSYNNTLTKYNFQSTWNAGGSSQQKIHNYGGYVEITASNVNMHQAFGLNTSKRNYAYNQMKFCIYLYGNQVRVYESGNHKGTFGNYVQGDIFQVRVTKEGVKYYKNNQLLYLSSASITLPMIGEFSLYNRYSVLQGAYISTGSNSNFSITANNLGTTPTYQWKLNGNNIGTNSPNTIISSPNDNDLLLCNIQPDIIGCELESSSIIRLKQIGIKDFGKFHISNNETFPACKDIKESITWKNVTNIYYTSENVVEKIQGGNNWYHGATSSLNTLTNGSSLEFKATETNKGRIIGLAVDNNVNHYNSIDFSLFLRENGRLYIYENGQNKKDCGNYFTNDEFKIAVIKEKVHYFHNGNLLYISTKTPASSLVVDLSFNHVNGTIKDIEITNGSTGSFSAYSTDLGTNPTYQWKLNGVTVGNNSEHYTNTGIVHDDTISCVITPDLVGCDQSNYPSENLIIKDKDIATLGSVFITYDSVTTSCQHIETIVSWDELKDIQKVNHKITKIQGGNNWNTGYAFSKEFIHNGGYVEFLVTEVDKKRAVGISNLNQGTSYTSIDYLFFLNPNGILDIYEYNNKLGSYGMYQTGDKLRISIEKNQVKYYRNNELLLISISTPTLPMSVDIALYDLQSSIDEVKVGNGCIGSLEAQADFFLGNNPIYEWELENQLVSNIQNYTNTNFQDNENIICQITPDIEGCYETKFRSNINTILSTDITKYYSDFYIETKSEEQACKYSISPITWKYTDNIEVKSNEFTKIQGGNNFNNGKATSYNKVYNGGYLKFYTQQVDKEKIIGLSNSSNGVNISPNDIDYAILLNNSGYYRIQELGVAKDLFHTYQIGDNFMISIEKNEVKYYHNDTLFYISQTSPKSNYPFVVQSIFKHVGGNFSDVKIANGTQSQFFAREINMGNANSYQWKLNGIPVGTDNNTYENYNILDNDVVICSITPNIGGCSNQNSYDSPTSTLKNRNVNINSNFYITNQRITGCKEAYENVVWQNVKGLMVYEKSLQKVQGENNWNIGSASSANTVNESGYMRFTASETVTNRYIGLSSQDLGEDVFTIEYSFFLNNNSKFQIYESGVPKAVSFLDYEVGDQFKITIESSVVKYYHDGSLLYISTKLPTSIPLIVEANIETKGGTLENIQIINTTQGNLTAHVNNLGTPNYQWVLDSQFVGNNSSNYDNNFIEDNQKVYCTIQPNLGGCTDVQYNSSDIVIDYIKIERFGSFYLVNDETSTGCKEALEHVTWTNLINVESNDNHNLEKIQGSYGWNAGATSYNHVRDGGYVYTVISEVDKKRMIGLSTVSPTNADVAVASIDFALFPKSDSTLELYEKGILLGTYGTYETGDTLKIGVEKGQVKYYRNQEIIYISLKEPVFPMIVDVAMEDKRSTLKNIYVSNPTIGNFSTFADRVGENPIYEWTHNNNIVGGNQTTYSNPNVTNRDEIVCYLTPDLPGCHTTKYKSGTITTNNTNIVRYGEFHIENKPTDLACKEAFEIVSWEETKDVSFRKGYVQKIQKNDVWDAGASSYNKVYNNGYAFTVINENNTDRAFSLSTVNSISYPNLDYTIYISYDDRLVIYESGIWKAEINGYQIGDTLSIKIDENVVKYFKNTDLLYTSESIPSFPLFVNVALRNSNSILKEIYVVNLTLGEFNTITTNTGDIISYKWTKEGESIVTQDNTTVFDINYVDAIYCTSSIKPSMGGCIDVEYTAHPVLIKDSKNDHMFDFTASTKSSNNVCITANEKPVWDQEYRVFVNGDNVTKDKTNNKWNAGAFSLNKVNDNGRMKFIVSETNTYRAIGLSHQNTNHHFNTIDYCIYLKDNAIAVIYEKGIYKKELGVYSINDTLSIQVDNQKVKYFKNRELIYASSSVPTLPLSVDISLYTSFSKLSNISIVNGTGGIFESKAVVDGKYYWKTNENEVANNLSQYTDYQLEEGDMIICEYQPNLAGCVRKMLTNSVEIKEPISNNLVINNTNWLGSESTDWFNPNNWSDGVPHPSSVVNIPSNASNQPELNNFGGAYSIHLENNASLTLNSQKSHLRVFNNWTNEGNFTANYGTVTFSSCLDDTVKIVSNNLETYYNLVVDNRKHVKIQGSNQKILNNLTILRGIINSPNDTIFIMDNATVSNVTDSTYINGTVSKIGNDSFVFPIGSATNYKPIEISAPELETDQFVATYCPVNPLLHYSNSMSNTLEKINETEYWILDRVHGSSEVNVTLKWDDKTNINTEESEMMCISRFDGEKWQNHGQSNFEKNDSTLHGNLTTSAPVISFSPFTFGTQSATALPIELISFNASEINEGILVEWKTASENNNDYFLVEKSTGMSEWEAIEQIKGTNQNNNVEYSFLDENKTSSLSYYRLKQVDYNGEYTYSKIVSVSSDAPNLEWLVYPNPTTGYLNISNLGNHIESIDLVDIYGRKINTFFLTDEHITIDLSTQIEGIYFIQASFQNNIISQKVTKY